MSTPQLVHPIYLNVPMMSSFVAALNGGYVSQVSHTLAHSASDTKHRGMSGQAGAGGLLTRLLSAQISADVKKDDVTSNTLQSNFELHYAEAAWFMLMRDELLQDSLVVNIDDYSEDQWNQLEVFDLVEMTGYIRRSPAIDNIQRLAKIVDMFQRMLVPDKGKSNLMPQGMNKASVEQMVVFFKALQEDVQSSRIVDFVLEQDDLPKRSAVLNVDTEVLALENQERLICGNVMVLGKITRVLPEGETIDLYRRTAFATTGAGILGDLVKQLAIPGITSAASDTFVVPPAIEVIPMAIFV